MRPFRFGLSLRDIDGLDALRSAAVAAEAAGFGTVTFADHMGSPAPMVMAMAAAAVTDDVRVGTHVLSNDFRHPAVLAHEAATVDLLSQGRFELGLGAGWARDEYAAAGLAFDRGGTRVDRLEEALEVLRAVLAGEPATVGGRHYRVEGLHLENVPVRDEGIPILVGGNGNRIVSVAARLADIVQFTGFTHTGTEFDLAHFSEEGLASRVAVVREAAGERFADLELGILVQRVVITDDVEAEIAAVVERGYDEATARTTPHILMGTVGEIAARCRELRDRYGITYFTLFQDRCDGFEAVIAELAGS